MDASRRLVPLAALLLLALSSADAIERIQDDAASKKGAALSDENDPAWHPEVLEIARHYRVWRRLDDGFRFAPTLCMMPTPPAAQYSKARAKTPHATKLYTLYAKDPEAYGALPTPFVDDEDKEILARFDDLEQVIIKEAWKPEVIGTGDEDARLFDPLHWGKSGLRPVKMDGKWWRGDEPAGLFLMFKPREPDAGTDAGWIYATVSPDLKTVTGAGRMASCMQCHQKHEGRLFGLPEDSPARKRD